MNQNLICGVGRVYALLANAALRDILNVSLGQAG